MIKQTRGCRLAAVLLLATMSLSFARADWPGFPYKGVNDFFDVFLPMSYFTWRTAGYANVRKYIGLNIRKVREGTGDKDVPIHVIGGLAGAAPRREVQALVNTAHERHIAGVSLYDFSITEGDEWEVMDKARAGP